MSTYMYIYICIYMYIYVYRCIYICIYKYNPCNLPFIEHLRIFMNETISFSIDFKKMNKDLHTKRDQHVGLWLCMCRSLSWKQSDTARDILLSRYHFLSTKDRLPHVLRDIAIHCNTLQHTATYCFATIFCGISICNKNTVRRFLLSLMSHLFRQNNSTLALQ